MRKRSPKLSGLIIVILCAVPAALAQSLEPRPAQAASTSLRIQIKPGATPLVTLRAKNALLNEIAQEIGRQLRAPVIVSEALKDQQVSLDVKALPLEATLRLLSPQPFIHYEYSGSQTAYPKLLGIYLYAFNEAAPAPQIKNKNYVYIIEGDTEANPDAPGNDPAAEDEVLRVVYNQNRLSVRARKQPLIVVLSKIAGELGIPFDAEPSVTEIVDVDFKGLPLEAALKQLSPLVRLQVRADLVRFFSAPLLLVLAKG